MQPNILSFFQYVDISRFLISKGWFPLGPITDMKYVRHGKLYDLSAADLKQLERIEHEGLFLVGALVVGSTPQTVINGQLN